MYNEEIYHGKALRNAIRYFGSQEALARQLGAGRYKINRWLNSSKRIPFEYAVAIERLTHGAVSCYELAPYARWISKLKA